MIGGYLRRKGKVEVVVVEHGVNKFDRYPPQAMYINN